MLSLAEHFDLIALTWLLKFKHSSREIPRHYWLFSNGIRSPKSDKENIFLAEFPLANVVKLHFDGATFIFHLQSHISMSFMYSWARFTKTQSLIVILLKMKDVVRSSAKRTEKPVDDVWWAGISFIKILNKIGLSNNWNWIWTDFVNFNF